MTAPEPERGEKGTRERTPTRSSNRGGRPPRKRRQRPAADAPVSPRTGAKRTVMGMIKQLPAYLRLLGGLLTDRRVDRVDKLLVGAAIAYILMPIEWVPDFIPFLGQVDDVFLLATSLRRLIDNAGRTVLRDHWTGDPSELSALNLERVIASAAFFLPRSIRRRLRVIGRAA